ncbi:MAG: serine/threonine-protein kinase [Acidobacteriota bacterium]
MQCPQCLKAFPQEKSFCPFDGSPLLEAKDRADYAGYIIDNKYELDEKIGEGTTGTIYKATHLQLQAPVAIKLMRRDLVNNPTAIERFRREAYAAMKIRHPNAIAVMDFGITADDLVYVVMEFLVGMPLSDRLNERGRLGFLEANNIIQQVCAVLNIAHSRGIIHRDLKPDNIFLHFEDGQETVKVVDFGIAKLIQVLDGMVANNLTGMGSVIGTPHYISPEQCTARNIDPRSDIYSLGIILYRMLTGQLPFEGPNSMSVIYKQVTEPPKPLYEVAADIPALLNAVVMRALEKDPELRPPDVITFAHELAASVKVVTEQEFQKVFLNATDEDLEAAVLLTLDVSGSPLDRSGRFRFDPNSGKLRLFSGDLSQAEVHEAHAVDIIPDPDSPEPPIEHTGSFAAISTAVHNPLHGRFPECDLASVIHTLIGLRVTGSLLVYTTSGAARDLVKNNSHEALPPPFCSIFFDQGNVHTAKLGVRMGSEAFFQLFQMPVQGSYIFKPALLIDELHNLEPITLSGEDLWQEAITLKIELEEYREIYPDLLTQIEVCSERLIWKDKSTYSLADTIWYLLQQGEPNLAKLLAKAPCCNAKTFRIITLLLSTEQIRLIE